MNLLEAFVKIGVDDQASGKLDGITSGALAKATMVGNAMYDIAKGIASMAFSGVQTVVQGAMSGYATYEQLAGGISKLYGNAGQTIEEFAASAGKSIDEVRDAYKRNERAESAMAENAQNAWRTVQMSANDYMETATSFSAALVNSLGGDTEKAADQTDKAMRAIADNYNTFGSDITSVKNAFQGFAKANFTMLDNLKLGYGGTKSEMERLIADANEYAASIGEASDLSIDSFSDIVDAIELIQEKQNIAGASQKEALSTIEGSANAARASWDNLLTAIGSGDGEKISDSVKGIVTALFGTFDEELQRNSGGLVNNVLPIIDNIKTALLENIPMAAEEVGKAFVTAMMQSMGFDDSQIGEVIAGIEQRFDTLGQNVSTILSSISEAWTNFTGGFSETIDLSGFEGAFENAFTVVSTTIQGISQSAGSIGETLGTVTSTLGNLADSFGDGFLSTFDPEPLIGAFTTLNDTVGSLFEDIGANSGLVEGLGAALGVVATAVGEIAQAIANVLQFLEPILPAIGVVAGLAAILGPIQGIISAVAGAVGFLTTTVIPAIAGIQSFGGAIAALVTVLGGPIMIIAAVVAAIVAFIATNEDARKVIGDVWNAISGFLKGVIDGIIGFFKQLPENLSHIVDEVVGFFRNLPQNILNALGDLGGLLVGAGQSIINGFLSGLKGAWDSVTGFVGGIGKWIADHKGPKEYDLKLLVPNGQWIMKGFADSLKDSFWMVEEAVGSMSDITLGGPTISPTYALAGTSQSGLPPINVYMDYHAGEDGRKLVSDMVDGLRMYGYTMGAQQ